MSSQTLKENRPNAHLDTRAVWHTGNEMISFTQARVPYLSGISQTLGDYMGKPVTGMFVKIVTTTIKDLAERFFLPSTIDYLSLDTEGSEALIIQSIPSNIIFKAITVEHNYHDKNRDTIFKTLENRGYKRVREVQFDDWYLHESITDAKT